MDETTTAAQRKRRLAIFAGVVAVAIVVVAIVIGSGSGGSSATQTTTAPAASAKSSDLKGVTAIKAEFAGIPQTSNVLGSAGAKATMMIFADLQCPFCGEFENTAFPTIVARYVRTGKLKVIFQPIVILGKDSILGARAAAAAGQQNKLFDFAATLYRNQGQENTGYLNEAYVEKIAGAVAGLDVSKLKADLKSAPVNKLLNAAQATAASGKVSSTPSFFLARRGGTLQPLSVTALDASAFTKALDAVTR